MVVENLETERLRFRRLTLDDMSALGSFFSSEEALQFLNQKVNDREACEAWIKRQQRRYEKGSGLCAVIEKSSGQLAGQCGLLFQEVDGAPELEIGYHFIPRFWGRGYATEAAVACRDLAFSHNLSESIISIVDVNNVRSQKVALRNGMKQTKRTRWKDFDVIIYRIMRSEWEKERRRPND